MENAKALDATVAVCPASGAGTAAICSGRYRAGDDHCDSRRHRHRGTADSTGTTEYFDFLDNLVLPVIG